MGPRPRRGVKGGQVRPIEEIQEAHDRLVPIILGEIDLELDEETKKAVHGACDVICWVLCHDHNNAFADNLEKLRSAAEERGYALRVRMEKLEIACKIAGEVLNRFWYRRAVPDKQLNDACNAIADVLKSPR